MCRLYSAARGRAAIDIPSRTAGRAIADERARTPCSPGSAPGSAQSKDPAGKSDGALYASHFKDAPLLGAKLARIPGASPGLPASGKMALRGRARGGQARTAREA